jgi:YfiH family protein
MLSLLQYPIAEGVVHVRHTTRSDGDLSPSAVEASLLDNRRRSLVDRPWFALHQVHSDRVIQIDAAAVASSQRPPGDALVTRRTDVVLAVHSGDCVPVAMVHPSGAIAAVHAGWRGLESGVLESAKRSLSSIVDFDAASLHPVAAVGPHIRAAHYEFDPAVVEQLSARFGVDVSAETARGTTALDLTTAVAAELLRLGVETVAASDACTAAQAENYWSHRARNETGRIALLVWIERP